MAPKMMSGLVGRRDLLRAGVSIVGTGSAGGSTGFTRPGVANILLEEIRERVVIAKDFGTPDLISFVGQIQDDVPRRPLDRAVDCFPVIAEVNHPNVTFIICSAPRGT